MKTIRQADDPTRPIPGVVIHRSFDGHEPVIHLLAKGKVRKLAGATLNRWLAAIKPCEVRSTFAGIDRVLLALADRGCSVRYAPWSKTDLNGQKDTAQILARFAELPETVFYPYRPRPDLVNLRREVDVRDALIASSIASANRNDALERLHGEQPNIQKLRLLEHEERKTWQKECDKSVNALAAQIAHCRILKDISHVQDSYLGVAKIVVLLAGVERFHSVSAVWKYTGYDVIDGHAPRHERGKSSTFKKKVRTAVFQLIEAIYKNRENPWRAAYEKFRAAEYEAHDRKHPGCLTKDGHCTARAKRRVAKEILKKFFLACRHQRPEAHISSAAGGEINSGGVGQ